ncbi:CCR4-NOT transcription complex subunit 2-like [Xenia sp. Carnegie-2017]|uniref:CCR4-NOT transcription complex subunit 2-like n=1 Tax=Xenia sp. Carnegie-2017 TaxID=2897299 RepID=UPI001F04F5C5|nr:CCR4-NOT transcription complex subunit 2-like [Xenia sp. Carnegie-2017]
MSLIGTLKSKRPGFYLDNFLHDSNNFSSMIFNQSSFSRRSEKEPLPSHSSSQPGSHLNNFYSSPSVSAPGSQANYFGSGLGSPGGLNTASTVPGAPGNSRGLSGSPQFSRSISHPGYHSSQHYSPLSSNASSGFQHLNSSTSTLSSTQPGRGILSMGQRSSGVTLPPAGNSHMTPQAAFNSLGSKSTSRAPGLPVLTIGRNSPGSIAQQQQQQQQRSFLGSSAHNSLVSSTTLSSAFGVPRSNQNAFGLSSSSMVNVFSSTGLTGNSDTISSVSAINSGLDLSDFPVLANRGMSHVVSSVSSPSSTSSSSSYVGRPSYGLVSKRGEPTTEFTMLNEDFPALPGSKLKSEGATESSLNQENKAAVQRFGNQNSYEQAVKDEFRTTSQAQNTQLVKGKIQTSPSGTISNIPKHMVTDQFGMIGLLTFIRAAETEPNLVTLALGSDLTTLGLNLNSPESLYQTFGSPFSDSPCRPHEIDFNVPPEYRINSFIREKLSSFKLGRYGEDVLFYLYYTNEGDVLQLAAAAELYSRDWRYHKDERVWLTRVPGVEPLQKTDVYERGTYYIFDYVNWRKIAKEFHLEYKKLEEKPSLQTIAAQ